MAVPEMHSNAGRHRTAASCKDPACPDTATLKLIVHGPADRDPREWAQAWLRGAMLALAVLAAAAAVVSWGAQYLLVRSVKHSMVIAALEAGIPDVGALIFAALGIAVALDGGHALRTRTLNVACVGLSLGMNALASAPGWRDLAIWVMPSALYALASDTLIFSLVAGRMPGMPSMTFWRVARMVATALSMRARSASLRVPRSVSIRRISSRTWLICSPGGAACARAHGCRSVAACRRSASASSCCR